MSHLFGSCGVVTSSRDITPHLMSFLPSKGSDVRSTGGICNPWVVIWDPTYPSVSASLVRISTVCFDMSSAIAEDALGNLGTPLCWVSCACTPIAVGVLVVGSVLPPIGEVGDACIKYGARDVRRNGGVVEDAWFKSLVSIGVGQRMKGIVLFPTCVPVEPFELCQILGKISHSLVHVAEALDFPL